MTCWGSWHGMTRELYHPSSSIFWWDTVISQLYNCYFFAASECLESVILVWRTPSIFRITRFLSYITVIFFAVSECLESVILVWRTPSIFRIDGVLLQNRFTDYVKIKIHQYLFVPFTLLKYQIDYCQIHKVKSLLCLH